MENRSASTMDGVRVEYPDPYPELRIVTLEDSLFLSVQRRPNGSHIFGGYLYELWTLVAEQLKLTYRIRLLATRNFGALDANGTWAGLVGELAHDRADVALASLDMNIARASVIDYLTASEVDAATSGFYVRRGHRETPPLSDVLASLLRPLHVNVWWSVLVSLLVLSVVLRCTLRFEPRRAGVARTESVVDWTECLLLCLMTLARQAWAGTPSSASARVATITCWALSILIHASFTANLISLMSGARSEETAITSLGQFLERPDWRLALPNGTGELNYWRVSANRHERALYERYKTGQRVIFLTSTSERSMRRTTEERVLTFVDLPYVSRAIGQDVCLLAPLSEEPQYKRFTFIGISKNNKRLRAEINQVLLRMKSHGLISRLKRRWVTTHDIVCKTPTGYRELTFSDLFDILVIVPISVIISTALFVLEHVVRYAAVNLS